MKKQEYRPKQTYHSARKTIVTDFVHQNIPDTRIVHLSWHKNVQSINYFSVALLEQQREMLNILSTVGTGMTNGIKKCKSSKHDENMNEIVEMPVDEDEVSMSASQEAELELYVVLKDTL